jgi:F-type H+-transporting ATPase subunit delta
MSQNIVAHRYAHALFLVAQRRGTAEQVLTDLQGLLAVVDTDSRVGRFFRSPLVRADEKRRLLHAGLDDRVLPYVRELVDLLLRKKRLASFRAVIAEYEALLEAFQGIQRAEVVSAVPLNADESKRLHAELERMTKKTIQLTAKVDPSVVGGVYVRIGDRIIDRTVKSLLEAVEHRLFVASV